MMFNQALKERFKKLVDPLGFTKSRCANVMGISYQTLLDIYTVGRVPNIRQLLLIADYFDVSLDYLLGRTDEKRIATMQSKEFRDRFRNLVNELGIRWIKCPKIIGITKAAFLGAYKFGYYPSTKALQRIADFFGVSVNYLLGYTDEK